MRIRTIVIFGILLLFISCKQDKNKETTENRLEIKKAHKPEAKLQNETTLKEKSSAQFIENDSMVRVWLNQVKKISKSEINFKVDKLPQQNLHNESLIDTIKTLTFDKSKIIIYVGLNFESIKSAEIKNTELPLSNIIKIGMKKDVFEKFMPVEIKSNILSFGNLEQTTLFTFIFKNNKLNIIELEAYVD